MNDEEMQKAFIKARAKQDRKMSYLLLERAFTGNFNISENTVSLYKRGQKTEKIDKETFYKEICFMLQRMCSNAKMDKKDNKQQYVFESFSIIVLIEKALRLFYENNKDYDNFLKELNDIYLDLKNNLSDDDYQDIVISILSNILDSNKRMKSDKDNEKARIK